MNNEGVFQNNIQVDDDNLWIYFVWPNVISASEWATKKKIQKPADRAKRRKSSGLFKFAIKL